MQELLQIILPALVSGVLGAIGGGWWMFRRKSGAVKAKLAAGEYQDVSTMVSSYLKRLAEMSDDITNLHGELLDIKNKQQVLLFENELLRVENQELRDRINSLESGINQTNRSSLSTGVDAGNTDQPPEG